MLHEQLDPSLIHDAGIQAAALRTAHEIPGNWQGEWGESGE